MGAIASSFHRLSALAYEPFQTDQQYGKHRHQFGSRPKVFAAVVWFLAYTMPPADLLLHLYSREGGLKWQVSIGRNVPLSKASRTDVAEREYFETPGCP